MAILLWCGAALSVLSALFAWCCCVVASRADDAAETFERRDAASQEASRV